jgi:hypothetical protein
VTRGSAFAWATAGVAATVAVTTGLVLAPMWVGPIVAVAAAAGLTAIRPKAAAGVAFLAVLWAREAPIVTGVQLTSYLDEASVVLAAVLFAVRRLSRHERLRAIPGGRWFLLWIAIGVAGSVAGAVPPSLWVMSGLLSIKGVLFAWAVAQIDWTTEDLRRIAHLGAWLLLAVLLCAAVQFVIPDSWAAVFANTGQVDRRSGPLPSLTGPFAHPGEFGLIASCAAIATLAWRNVVSRSISNAVLLWGSLLGTLLSFRRKSIIGLVLSSLLVSLKSRLRRTVLALVFAMPIALYLAWPTLVGVVNFTATEYLTDPDGTARIVLTRDSFAVALAHFPFGAGFGRFGSYLAGVHYSPEYLERGYPAIWGLGNTPGNGNALTDTQWPAAIGETGLFGAAALAVALVLVYRRASALFTRSDAPTVRWIALVCMGWSVQFVVESSASAVYNSSPLYPLLFGAVGLVAALPASGGGGHRGDVVGPRDRLRVDRRRRGDRTGAHGERPGVAGAGEGGSRTCAAG